MSFEDIELPEENTDLPEEDINNEEDMSEAAPSGKFDKLFGDNSKKFKLSKMFREWYIDYSSYTVLYRAVPHLIDGLKPVQRRVLHAMWRMDDGSYTKVANIVGQAMQFHPHGDQSILGALVWLGQRNYLVDCQGNWGNILTGDSNAAPRYIEARLSKFGKEVVFNPKTTNWMTSYDGRNQEPIELPVKFPILLAQGTEGIGAGFASKILPHNFNELIDASIAILQGKDFEIFPDFLTGGAADCSKYSSKRKGGKIKIRARIEKIDKNIIITLPNDVSPDKTIDALYAFTACEVSITPNTCVILDNKPQVLSVNDMLRYSTEHTRELLGMELSIRLNELENDWHYNSLEKIFFENKVYKILEGDAKTWEDQLQEVLEKMLTYQALLKRPILMEDINRLVEKPVRKISKFDVKAVDEKLRGIEDEMAEVQNHLDNLTEFTINYFKNLKKKYGKAYPRLTELVEFENIETTRVVSNNAKLYANKAEGFVGIALKKEDNAEFICDCSDLSEIIVIQKDGKYKVTKVSEKAFFGKDILYVGLFDRNDQRTIYNVIYREGKTSLSYAKRFAVTSITRDKEYDITQGTPGSTILWFTVNHNGEAETVRINFRPRPKLKKTTDEYDFSELGIKGRAARGNLVSKNPIQKITLKSKGVSTIGGKDIWFDEDIQRLNEDGRGLHLGQFTGEDHVLAIFKDGTYYTTSSDLSSRYQGDLLKIEKLDTNKVHTVLYYDKSVASFYVKRFSFDVSDNTPVSFISDSKGSYLVAISDDLHPQFEITFGGKNVNRDPEQVDAEEFIAKKGLTAKGKKVSALDVKSVVFIEPLHKPEDDIVPETSEAENQAGEIDNSDVEDPIDIDFPDEDMQLSLF